MGMERKCVGGNVKLCQLLKIKKKGNLGKGMKRTGVMGEGGSVPITEGNKGIIIRVSPLLRIYDLSSRQCQTFVGKQQVLPT